MLLLARHFDQQLDDFITIQERRCRANPAAPDRLAGRVPRRRCRRSDMHDVLQAKVGRHSDVAGVNVFDSDGALINSSERWPVPNVNIADRPSSKPSNREPRRHRF